MGERLELARLLQDHQQAFRDRRNPFYCTCDQWVAVVVADGKDGNGVTIEDQHLAHLADVISSWYADRIAARVAAVEALLDDRVSRRGNLRGGYFVAVEDLRAVRGDTP